MAESCNGTDLSNDRSRNIFFRLLSRSHVVLDRFLPKIQPESESDAALPQRLPIRLLPECDGCKEEQTASD